MSIENDVENPHDSPIFSKYPSISTIMSWGSSTDYLRMMVGGNLNALEINLMDMEIETHHHEVEVPGHVMARTGDTAAASVSSSRSWAWLTSWGPWGNRRQSSAK